MKSKQHRFVKWYWRVLLMALIPFVIILVYIIKSAFYWVSIAFYVIFLCFLINIIIIATKRKYQLKFILMIGLLTLFMGAIMNFIVIVPNHGMPVLNIEENEFIRDNVHFTVTDDSIIFFPLLIDRYTTPIGESSLGDFFIFYAIFILTGRLLFLYYRNKSLNSSNNNNNYNNASSNNIYIFRRRRNNKEIRRQMEIVQT